MPYLIFIANGEEYDRRDLRGPMLLGRAPDCDLAIPDITLSRHHCRVEPSENGRGWQLVDLHSKNGSQFRGQNILCHVFRDGDELRIGRTRVTFKAGRFVKGSALASARSVLRAVDPHEALSGTVSGMVVCEPGETERHQGMPIPQPRAMAPSSSPDPSAPEPAAERTRRAAPRPGITHAVASHDETAPSRSASDSPRHAQPAAARHAHSPPHGEQRISFDLQADHAEPAPRPTAGLLEPDRRHRASPMLIGVASAAGLAAVLFLAAWASVSFSSRGAQAPAPPLAAPAADAQTRADASDDLAIAASAVDRSAGPSAAIRRRATADRHDVRTQPLMILPAPPALRNRYSSPSAIDLDFVSAPAHTAHPVDIVPDDLLSPIGPSHVHRQPSAP